jgi:hypothetical protein
MGARVYDPYTGTFTQPDPIQGGGANAYGYTDGDPVNETDLDGEAVNPICARARGKSASQACYAKAQAGGPSLGTIAKIGGDIATGVACVDLVTCGFAVAANEGLDAAIDVSSHHSGDLVADTVTNVATFGFGGADIALRAAEAPTAFVVSHQLIHTALTTFPDAAGYLHIDDR